MVDAIVMRPLPVRDPDRLAVLSLTDRRGEATRLINYSTYAQFVADQQVFEGLFAYSAGGIFPLEARGTLAEPSHRSFSTCWASSPCPGA